MIIEIPKIIKTKYHSDHRGYLQEIYLKKRYKNNFKFSLITSSKKNVFRGFHFQIKKQQAKIVYLAKGEILDIVIDSPESTEVSFVKPSTTFSPFKYP